MGDDVHKAIRIMIEVISSCGRIQAKKLAILIATDQNINHATLDWFYGADLCDEIEKSFYAENPGVFGEFEKIHGRPLSSWERYKVLDYVWRQYQKVTDTTTLNYSLPLS